MSKLAQLLRSAVGAANLANSANPDDASGKVSNISNISSGASPKSLLPGDLETHAEGSKAATLSSAQAAARQEVLAQLEAHPTIKRAFVNRFDEDGTMVVTLAIRGVGTGELLIPADRFHQGSLDDFGALIDCVQREGDA
jgi:hypothetical protein